MAARINADELSDELRAQLGLPKRKRQANPKALTKEKLRSRAIDVLAEISDLTQKERERVLQQALKVNAV